MKKIHIKITIILAIFAFLLSAKNVLANGKTEIGIFRGGTTWYLDFNGTGYWDSGDVIRNFGVAGDWNGITSPLPRS